MKKNKILLILILVFVLLIIGAYILYGQLSETVETDQLATQENTSQTTAPEQSEEPEPEKVVLPDFTVYDRDGNEVHLSDFRGKPVVLNFWASWCGPCKSEMPAFDAAYAELGDEIHFLMVNMTTSFRESFENATEFIDEQGYSFPVFYDTDSDVAMTYGIQSFPTTLFIDSEGHGIAQATGAINGELLQKGIDMIR